MPLIFLSEMHFESNFHSETVILMLILAFLPDWAGWGWCWWLRVSGVEEGDSNCVMLQDRGSGEEQKSMWLKKCKGGRWGGWKSSGGNSQVPGLIN